MYLRVGSREVKSVEEKMKNRLAILFAFCTIFVSKAPGQQALYQPLPMMHASGVLRLVETIPLPTEGYMDRLAADIKGQRLFICGENDKTLVIIDLQAGKVIHETHLA